MSKYKSFDERIGLRKHGDESVNSQFFRIMTWMGGFLAVSMSIGYTIINYGYAGHGEFFKREGVTKRILGRPENERYHEIEKIPEGFIAKIGAIEQLLDEDGKPLTQELQKIERTGSGWKGKLGSLEFIYDNNLKLLNPEVLKD